MIESLPIPPRTTMPVNPESLKDVEQFYLGLDERFATLALTAPTGDVFDLPDNPLLDRPATPVVMGYKNNGYLPPARRWDSSQLPDFSKKPELVFINVDGTNNVTPDELEARRASLIEAHLVKLLGSADALTALRDGLAGQGIAKDSYLYRAPHKSDRYKGKVMLLNHLDPSANFENEAMFEREASQVRHYATDPEYSGDIIRLKIEEPAFYRNAGMPSAPRIVPMFPHYVRGDQIEVSKDLGTTWQQTPTA